MSDPGFFEILDNTRAIKRLKRAPVPIELIRKVLDAGTKAPSGVNTQPWEFLVVHDLDEVSLVALLPIGFPQGRFGPVTRKPALDLTHFDRWGRGYGERVPTGEAVPRASIRVAAKGDSTCLPRPTQP